MAYTQTDLDNIKSAIASGVLTVRYGDGSMVTYASVDELIRVRREIESELNKSTARKRLSPRYRSAVFSDG